MDENIDHSPTVNEEYGRSKLVDCDENSSSDHDWDNMSYSSTESDDASESDTCAAQKLPIQHPCIDTHTKADLLPFPDLPRTWYVKEERLYNSARDARRLSNPIKRDSNNTI